MADTYSVVMTNQTIVADGTLVIVHAASSVGTRGSVLEVVRAWAAQVGTDTNDQIGILIGQKVTAFGTYSSTTPGPHNIGGPTSGITGGTSGAAGTAGTDASAEGAGGVTTIVADSFSNLNGYLWVPTPDERITMLPDTAIVLKIVGTPGTLTGWSAGLTFIEVN